MNRYLEINYPTEEFGNNDYPQKLCNYIYNRFLTTHISSKSNKTKLLDVGCGKGSHLIGFSRLGIETYGLDKKRKNGKEFKKIDIRNCNIEKNDFPFENNFFDFVFSKSVLEHVKKTDKFLNEILRVLKIGGVVVIMVPDWKTQHENFFDDYTHVKPFTRKGLQNAMKINNFRHVHTEYFLQLPFIWKFPFLKFITKIIQLLPDSYKWKNKEETRHRKLVRFSKEYMILAKGQK